MVRLCELVNAKMGVLRFALLCAIFQLEMIFCVKIKRNPTLLERLFSGKTPEDKCMKITSSCKGLFFYIFVSFFIF